MLQKCSIKILQFFLSLNSFFLSLMKQQGNVVKSFLIESFWSHYIGSVGVLLVGVDVKTDADG